LIEQARERRMALWPYEKVFFIDDCRVTEA
jgi:hypothetical protein